MPPGTPGGPCGPIGPGPPGPSGDPAWPARPGSPGAAVDNGGSERDGEGVEVMHHHYNQHPHNLHPCLFPFLHFNRHIHHHLQQV